MVSGTKFFELNWAKKFEVSETQQIERLNSLPTRVSCVASTSNYSSSCAGVFKAFVNETALRLKFSRNKFSKVFICLNF